MVRDFGVERPDPSLSSSTFLERADRKLGCSTEKPGLSIGLQPGQRAHGDWCAHLDAEEKRSPTHILGLSSTSVWTFPTSDLDF